MSAFESESRIPERGVLKVDMSPKLASQPAYKWVSGMISNGAPPLNNKSPYLITDLH